ncbi:MAG: virulence RhuM family protein [Candidatus Omnitrophota bacterium]
MTKEIVPNDSKIILYASDDGQIKVDVRFQGETAWLTQKLMAELFQTTIPNINIHIGNIFKEGELKEDSVIKDFLITASDGKKYRTKYYSLDMIISVGYRIKSAVATQFRIWATQRLKEYIIKGFALDDERLKQGGHKARYFQELLQRIRDIRSSERNFYQKVTDIYATSIDYRKDDKLTKEFFATVQNKMHYAVHGHTAAEIIVKRADSGKPLMGLTSFKGNYITAPDTKVAKNYLTETELKQLNLIVSMYLDFAELQAANGRLMKMADWIAKLDEFLKLSERKLLTDAGSVSAEEAAQKAEEEFAKFSKERNKDYISDFDKVVKKIMHKKKRETKKE